MYSKDKNLLIALATYTTVIWFVLSASATGAETVFNYDSHGRLVSVSEVTQSGETSKFEYTYDDVGNRTFRAVNPNWVSVACEENGTCSPTGKLFVEDGETVEVTITPDDDYAVYDVYILSDGQYLWSLWSMCSQASDNSVILTIEDIDTVKQNFGVEGTFEIGVAFYKLTGLAGDVNGDCSVDETDTDIMISKLAAMILAFPPCDLNGDGLVSYADYRIVLAHMGETCD